MISQSCHKLFQYSVKNMSIQTHKSRDKIIFYSPGLDSRGIRITGKIDFVKSVIFSCSSLLGSFQDTVRNYLCTVPGIGLSKLVLSSKNNLLRRRFQ